MNPPPAPKFLGITLSILFIGLPSLFAGLAPKTKITTPTNVVCVESLKVGNTICGYGPTTHAFPDAKIKNIEPVLVESIYVITTKHGAITASADQLFYEITSESFIPSEQIKPGQLFLTKDIKALECIRVECKNIQTTVYDLTLEEPHLFFSSDAQILTHNAVPILLLGIPLAAPVIKFVASVGAIAGALYFEKVATSSLPIFKQCREQRERKAAHRALFASLNQPKEDSVSNNKPQTPQPPPIIDNTTPSGGQPPDPNDPKKRDDEENKWMPSKKTIENRSKSFADKTEKELKRAKTSLTKQIEKHEEKLKKYLENPDCCDNHGYLKKATSLAERQTRINERVASLKKQIRGFKLDFDICTEFLKQKIG